jgi:hypothetical protein
MRDARRLPHPDVVERLHRRARALDDAKKASDDFRETYNRCTAEIGKARETFIRALRTAYEAGATQEEIGEMLGLSRQRIAQLLRAPE